MFWSTESVKKQSIDMNICKNELPCNHPTWFNHLTSLRTSTQLPKCLSFPNISLVICSWKESALSWQEEKLLLLLIFPYILKYLICSICRCWSIIGVLICIKDVLPYQDFAWPKSNFNCLKPSFTTCVNIQRHKAWLIHLLQEMHSTRLNCKTGL